MRPIKFAANSALQPAYGTAVLRLLHAHVTQDRIQVEIHRRELENLCREEPFEAVLTCILIGAIALQQSSLGASRQEPNEFSPMIGRAGFDLFDRTARMVGDLASGGNPDHQHEFPDEAQWPAVVTAAFFYTAIVLDGELLRTGRSAIQQYERLEHAAVRA